MVFRRASKRGQNAYVLYNQQLTCSSKISNSIYIGFNNREYYTKLYSNLERDSYNFNSFYKRINTNSLFTDRQIDIICKRLESRGTIENISSGAYYRQVKQCRTKIIRLLYSIIFLKYIGALDHETFFAIEKIGSQLEVMLAQKTSDFSRAESVILVIEQLVKRMCKV
jgi:hypothetical protein